MAEAQRLQSSLTEGDRVMTTSGLQGIVVDSAERRVWLEDLASKNGTRLRGTRVRDRVELSDGDEVTFGAIRVKLRSWNSTTAAETKRIARGKR